MPEHKSDYHIRTYLYKNTSSVFKFRLQIRRRRIINVISSYILAQKRIFSNIYINTTQNIYQWKRYQLKEKSATFRWLVICVNVNSTNIVIFCYMLYAYIFLRITANGTRVYMVWYSEAAGFKFDFNFELTSLFLLTMAKCVYIFCYSKINENVWFANCESTEFSHRMCCLMLSQSTTFSCLFRQYNFNVNFGIPFYTWLHLKSDYIYIYIFVYTNCDLYSSSIVFICLFSFRHSIVSNFQLFRKNILKLQKLSCSRTVLNNFDTTTMSRGVQQFDKKSLRGRFLRIFYKNIQLFGYDVLTERYRYILKSSFNIASIPNQIYVRFCRKLDYFMMSLNILLE